MFNLIKKVAKYAILFFALCICSGITIYILTLTGLQFDNSSNVAFIAALMAEIYLVFINRGIQKRKNEENIYPL